jgi:ribosomal 50S subunit-associated protein YjgA (DUF615 family)
MTAEVCLGCAAALVDDLLADGRGYLQAKIAGYPTADRGQKQPTEPGP